MITGQTAYEGKSQEELRLEDYRKGLRGPSAGGGKDVLSLIMRFVCISFTLYPTSSNLTEILLACLPCLI